MSSTKKLLEELAEANPDALLADGFESAFIGIRHRFREPPLAAYSFEKCILILMERDKMTFEGAVEFFEFNVIGAWMGAGTPVFVRSEPIR